MNVFVLCTGRCGSVAFIKSASHISNFTAGHETRCRLVGEQRLGYPANHIEADNRLAWFLGRLGERYGKGAFYVHLRRDDLATAGSFAERWGTGIIAAYADSVLMGAQFEPIDICLDYVRTVNANIEAFLADKPNQMTFQLETAKTDWPEFWRRIGAEGDLAVALLEWDVPQNSGPPVTTKQKPFRLLGRIRKLI